MAFNAAARQDFTYEPGSDLQLVVELLRGDNTVYPLAGAPVRLEVFNAGGLLIDAYNNGDPELTISAGEGQLWIALSGDQTGQLPGATYRLLVDGNLLLAGRWLSRGENAIPGEPRIPVSQGSEDVQVSVLPGGGVTVVIGGAVTGPPGPAGRDGRSVEWEPHRGRWNPSISYNLGSRVLGDDGNGYESQQPGNLNHPLTDGEWWSCYVSRGEEGPQGPTGFTETGPETPHWEGTYSEDATYSKYSVVYVSTLFAVEAAQGRSYIWTGDDPAHGNGDRPGESSHWHPTNARGKQGPAGPGAKWAEPDVETLATGSSATVEQTKTDDGKQKLKFGIPRGPKGSDGPAGPAGPRGGKGDKGDDGTNGRDGRDATDIEAPFDITGNDSALYECKFPWTVHGCTPPRWTGAQATLAFKVYQAGSSTGQTVSFPFDLTEQNILEVVVTNNDDKRAIFTVYGHPPEAS